MEHSTCDALDELPHPLMILEFRHYHHPRSCSVNSKFITEIHFNLQLNLSKVVASVFQKCITHERL
jgi:hypothetical protein